MSLFHAHRQLAVQDESDLGPGEAGQSLGEAKQRLVFVNKKEQKNFASLGRAGFTAIGPKSSRKAGAHRPPLLTFCGLRALRIT